jgi:hypothetical protein
MEATFRLSSLSRTQPGPQAQKHDGSGQASVCNIEGGPETQVNKVSDIAENEPVGDIAQSPGQKKSQGKVQKPAPAC